MEFGYGLEEFGSYAQFARGTGGILALHKRAEKRGMKTCTEKT